jgi:hypothetical protein
MEGQVQDCGCIALPESLQQKTGLYPGATYELKLTPDGTAIVLQPVTTAHPAAIKPGVQCA